MPTPGPTRRNTPGAGSVIGDRGQQTLQRLLAASGEVFAQHGFHDARIEEITSRAQVSRGAFYQYFDNKDAIFAALLEQVRADFATAIESASPVTGDVAGYWALHEFIGRYLAVCDRWAPMLPVFVEIETPDNPHATFGGRLLGAVIRSLDSQLLGPLPAGLQRRGAALSLIAMVDRFSYYASTSPDLKVSPKTVVDTLTVMAFRMLYPATTLSIAQQTGEVSVAG
jgi:AcrR family transcriptional regulator